MGTMNDSMMDDTNFYGDLKFLNDIILTDRDTDKMVLDHWLFSICFGTIGFMFNLIAILIFSFSNTFCHSTFRCYIYSFIIVHCICIFSQTWSYLLFHIGNPNILCKTNTFLQQSSSTCSLWIMVLLSSERSFTFMHPYKVKKVFTPKITCIVLCLIILISLLLHIDELFIKDISTFRWISVSYGICSIKREKYYFDIKIKILLYSISFILPFLLNSIFDIYICRQMCLRRKKMAHAKINCYQFGKKRTRSLTHEITLTLLCLSCWLLLTYFPSRLYYLLVSFNLIDYAKDNSILMILMRYNLLIYLAFSPTLYVILSPTLRNEIKQYICFMYNYHKVHFDLTGRRQINRNHNIKTNYQQERRKTLTSTVYMGVSMKTTIVDNLKKNSYNTDNYPVRFNKKVRKNIRQISSPIIVHKTANNHLLFSYRATKSEPILAFENDIIETKQWYYHTS
ncbi:unnamed protein product [Didymodactylos carnosus]|uniref:G-protein coupled receptors family 1 profile domain-containing protein n=1 Tax=Didymodactylos carnosus TaxID=1234261 RepID=A0A814W7Y0_9BILA|nr:unnamed protein product [Didymodactylos carnosus]CAF1576968.1 unnamed protein product [Didymodactylos carnosus]CAF3962192.1 unnamed protein product [Didymodactylos carnosus]CAF4374405.1 unnamed protein product [Didymodactylos carnosus]